MIPKNKKKKPYERPEKKSYTFHKERGSIHFAFKKGKKIRSKKEAGKKSKSTPSFIFHKAGEEVKVKKKKALIPRLSYIFHKEGEKL